MSSRTAGSSSSVERTRVAVPEGFRVERVIARGSRATVYEATQLRLGRRVALKVYPDPSPDLADRVRRAAWPEHPGAVTLYGSGVGPGGAWLAMQLVGDGATLDAHPARLDDVAAALECAHAAGTAHGAVRADNVLVSGSRALLTNWGLIPGTAAEDHLALARLRQTHQPPRRHRALAAAVGIGALVVAAGAAVAITRDDSRALTSPAGIVLGSDPPGAAITSVDCTGRPPRGSSPACTLMPERLRGRALVVPRDGTVISWAVRGARGPLALQVLRRQRGGYVAVARSRDVTIPGPSRAVLPANLAVAAGDRIALEVAPDAAVGIRRVAGAATARWIGPLSWEPRPPDLPAGTGLDVEVALQVVLRPGARRTRITPVRGARAARVPAGLVLATRDVRTAGGARTVTVVALGGAVALDLYDGTTRRARVGLPGADGRGRLIAAERAGAGRLVVRWRNPGGAVLTRTARAGPDAISADPRG